MPSYYRVSPKFWTDPAIRRCSDDAKLLALYLLTGPHRRLEGLFRLPKPYICADLGWSMERLAEPFKELLAERFGEPGFMAYDEAAEVVLIRKALKYQAPQNDNQVKAALGQLEDLPDTPLTSEFRSLAEQYCERLAQQLPERFGELIGNPPAPAPAPAPKDHPSGRVATAADLVADYVVGYRTKTGHDPPSRVKGHLARELRQALEDGVPYDVVRQGLEEWFTRDLHPSALASVIETQARNGRSRPTTRAERGRAQLVETDQALDQWANQHQEGGQQHGTSRVAQAGSPPQRQLPRPGTPT